MNNLTENIPTALYLKDETGKVWEITIDPDGAFRLSTDEFKYPFLGEKEQA